MKKVYLILASVLIIAAGCKKDETKTVAGGYSVGGTAPATEVSVKHNLYVDRNESIDSDMPKNAVIEAFHMTESQFNELWASGSITYSIKGSGDSKPDSENSFIINEKGEVATTGGVFRIQQPKDNFWKMKLYGIAGYEKLVGKTVSFTQVFSYTSGVKVTTTFAVPWKLKVVKNDPRIVNEKNLDGSTWKKTVIYDKGIKEFVIDTINADYITKVLGADTKVDSAYVYFNGAPVYKDKKFVRSDDMYFLADGTLTDSLDGNAALKVWYDKIYRNWKCSYTRNENTEGKDISVQIAFVDNNEEFALLYPIKVINTARKFMKVDSSWFAYNQNKPETGVFFNISVLKTSNYRESKSFDLPSATYDSLKVWGCKSLAEQINNGSAKLLGGKDSIGSTIQPYGHWFDRDNNAVLSSTDTKVAGFEMSPNASTGHCTFVLKNGNSSLVTENDTLNFVQYFDFAKDSVTLPVHYRVVYVDKI